MKKTIVDELKGAGMTNAEAERAFVEVAGAIARLVERGERVRLPKIGTLAIKRRAETRRRNPQSGETIVLAARDVVTLRVPRRS